MTEPGQHLARRPGHASQQSTLKPAENARLTGEPG